MSDKLRTGPGPGGLYIAGQETLLLTFSNNDRALASGLPPSGGSLRRNGLRGRRFQFNYPCTHDRKQPASVAGSDSLGLLNNGEPESGVFPSQVMRHTRAWRNRDQVMRHREKLWS